MRDKSLRSGERQYGQNLNEVEEWHRWRYAEIYPHIVNKTVMDVGCGVGYGAYIMAAVAKLVYAIDDSEEAIDHGRKFFDKDNIYYFPADFMNYPERMHNKEGYKVTYDVIVAFEFIEHVQDTDALFAKFEAYQPEKFIISSPHIKCPIGANKFHHRHYGMDQLINRFWDIGYKPLRAELRYFGKGLCNFLIAERQIKT